MSFFNNPASSSTQGSSGSSTTASGPGGAGIFGAQGATSNIFGAPRPANTGGLFGSNAPNTGTAGGLFGNSAASTPSSSIFGGGAAPASTSIPTFGGSGSGTTSATPSTSNTLFGSSSTTAASSTAPSNTNTLFGGGSAFTLPKPADQATNTPKNTPSSFFNQAGPSTTASSTNADGLSTKLAEGASTAASTAATSGGLFGGGIFGKPANSSATTPLAANKDAAPLATSGGLFGNNGNKQSDKKDATQTAPTTFNIFGGAKTDEKKDAPTPTGLNATTLKEVDKTTVPGSAAAAAVSSTTVTVPPPSMLRGKTLEEIVNRWTTELETHVREFGRFAGEVAVWDRALIENGNNIAALYSHVLAAERQQNDISQSLDHIEQQQADIASTLDAYEKVSQEILGGQGGSLRTLDTGPADTERDKNYMLATDLHTHLDDLSGSLTQMIDSVNALSISQKPHSDSGDDAMTQIAQILSSHLESLQWIDAAVREVESKVTDVEKRVRESGHSTPAGAKPRGFGLNR
ncbi:uncharacterized protein LACBIDRAFT_311958 [Laccaria bicolor S238N-H82]|uniref:Predicted protein n=1 Tax=Laccaria bicolor (strain S238N-H82 / ATCC MYA-4686) TaxID=486041 RepID=B0CYQ6_LACBS|nr:uncharacterized protein LACBIDRAFT_311958 [Laccaria bicolor S238N-H82]EDR12924.1 predicted protein [Laccaria bicolor S238N-H82]|eukprot:XP_001877188.1 predicted protein [Laccaria bicolor S238N-H82]